MTACCNVTLAQAHDDGPGTILTCQTCGRTWARSRNGWGYWGQQRRCVKCRHWSCPCCDGDWCDVIKTRGFRLCCGGECTYATAPVVQAIDRMTLSEVNAFLN